MIYRFVLASFVILLSIPSFSQSLITPDSSLQLLPYWKIGDSFNIKTSYTGENEKGKSSQFKSELFSKVIIMDSTNEGYVIEWRYTKMNIHIKDNSIENQIKRASKSLKLIYSVSQEGKFKELLNYEEIKKSLKKIFDSLALGFTDDPTYKSSLRQSQELFLTRKGTETLLMKDIKLFHLLFGYEFRLNETYHNQLKMPNVFGGPPFDAKEEVKLTKFNLSESTCIIQTKKSVDGADLKEALIMFFKNLPEQHKVQMNEVKTNDLKFTENTFHETDYIKGIVRTGIMNRTMKLGIQTSITTIRIDLINHPKY